MAVTKPEFIQEAETAWDTTTPKESPSITVAAGDELVAFAECEEVSGGTQNLSTPTGGGLTWKEEKRVLVNQYTEVALWTAKAAEAKTFKVTFARGATSRRFGGNVLVFRKSAGIGASVKTNVSSGAPTVNLTTEKEHSAIVVAVGDWAAVDGKSRAWRTNAGTLTEQTYNFTTGVWTVYGGYHADAGAAGTYAVGLSAPSAQKYSIVAVEVFGEESKSEAVDMEAAISGSGGLTGTLASVASLSASPSGAAALSGELRSVAAMSASLSGAGSLTGELRAVAAMEAALSGSGGLTGSLTSVAALSAALSAQGTLSGELRALASMVAGLIGTGSLTGELTALASFAADLEAAGILDGELTSVASLAAELSGQGSLTGLLEVILGQVGTLPTRARVDPYGARARITARELRAVVIPSRATRAVVVPNTQTAATVVALPATAATIVANLATRASIHERRTKAGVL